MTRNPSRPVTGWRPVLLVTATVLVADLASKETVRQSATLRRWPAIHLVDNPSWSMGIGGATGLVVPVLSALMLAATVWWLRGRLGPGGVRVVPAALLLGGGAANLVDRLWHGAVTDFLATPWLTINLADLAVVVGLVAFVATGGYRQLLRAAGQVSRPHPVQRRSVSAQ